MFSLEQYKTGIRMTLLWGCQGRFLGQQPRHLFYEKYQELFLPAQCNSGHHLQALLRVGHFLNRGRHRHPRNPNDKRQGAGAFPQRQRDDESRRPDSSSRYQTLTSVLLQQREMRKDAPRFGARCQRVIAEGLNSQCQVRGD